MPIVRRGRSESPRRVREGEKFAEDCGLLHSCQVQGEPALWVRPCRFAGEAGEVEDGIDYRLRELVAVLGVDALAFCEVHAHLQRADVDDLRTRAHKVHFHTRERFVPEVEMLEGGGVEI